MADMHLNQPVPSAGAAAASTNRPAGIIFPSASRTAATYTSDELFNPGCKGVRLFIVNDGAGGSTAVAQIQVRDPNTDVWVNLAGAATAAAGGTTTGAITTVYPGLTGIADAAGVTINQHLGTSWRVVLTIAVATGSS